MTPSIFNTGEAFLPPDEKRYARVALIAPQIEHDRSPRLAPAAIGLAIAVAVGALTLAASAV